MKRLNGDRMKLMLVVTMATIVFGSRNAKADFTFGEPVNLGPTVNSPSWDSGPRISADGLSLFFQSDRPDGLGNFDLWMATREAIDETWGEPVNLGSNINSPNDEASAAISPNGLELYFQRSIGTWEHYILVSKRSSKDAPWSPAEYLDQPINPGPSIHPELSSDGLSLYFCSNDFRGGGLGRYDIWVSTKETSERNPEGSWSEPVNLGSNVNSPKHEYSPSISSDGRILMFDSYRAGSEQAWLSVRSDEDDGWGSPMLLGPEINSSNYMGGPEISPDGLSLYYTARDSSLEIYESKILPIVDLNADGIVDAADMVIMVDHWGTDNSLCDIGPMPWGDGVVDVQDLIVLTEHLFEELPGRAINP